MGICGIPLSDGTTCPNETVWNDVCEEHLHEQEDRIYDNDSFDSFIPDDDWEQTIGRDHLSDVVDLQSNMGVTINVPPQFFLIKSTDPKFLIGLVDFLANYKVQKDSTELFVSDTDPREHKC